MLDEEDFIHDGKYRGYTGAMDKALKNFEYSCEWPDLISALGKLTKVISSHSKIHAIPRRLLLSKRLSQCLHPTLPSGVHLKALETYDLIFKCIGTEKLGSELFIYAPGLFPLLAYAGISVRPALLNIYETHLLGLGEKLGPCLDGFLPAVLLGMEETSDFYQRITTLLDSVKNAVGVEKFYHRLWCCVESIPSARQPAINYMLGNKEEIGGEELVLSAIRLCLVDTNILVQRASLELLTTRDLGKGLELVKAALRTLLRRDTSLNRRLYTWLSGSEDELVIAIQSLLCDAEEDNFRILIYLFDKSDVCELILDRVLVDVVRSVYIHSGSILRSANLFFSTLHPTHIWDHFLTELRQSIVSELNSRVQRPGSGKPSLPELCLLLSFLMDLDCPLDKTHLPELNAQLSQLVVEKLGSMSGSHLHSLLSLLDSFKSQTSPVFYRIYSSFVTSSLFKIPINPDTHFNLLLNSEIDIYSEFESGLFQSLHLMSEKCVTTLPSLPVYADAETFECFRLLNSILAKNPPNEDEWLGVSQCLLVATTMGESDAVRVSSIQTLLLLLDLDSASNSSEGGALRDLVRRTQSVDVMTEFLWSRMPLYSTLILTLSKLFPSNVGRTLAGRVNDDPKYIHVIHLLRQNVVSSCAFDSIVLKCLDQLDSQDAERKISSESFVFEFLPNVGVVVDPLLRIFEVNAILLESVLTFVEDEQKEVGWNEGRKETPPREELAAGSRPIVDADETETDGGPRLMDLRKRTELFVDTSGRISSKVDSDDEFEEMNGGVGGESDEEMAVIESDGEEILNLHLHDNNADENEQNESYVEFLDSMPEEVDIEEPLDSISENVYQKQTEESCQEEVDVEAEVHLVLAELDMNLERSLASGEEEEERVDPEVTLTPATPEKEELSAIEEGTMISLNGNGGVTSFPNSSQRSKRAQKLFSIHPYNTQFHVYTTPGDHPRVIYALHLVRNVLGTNPRAFLIAICTTVSSSRVTYLELLLFHLLRLSQGFYNERPDTQNVSIHVEAIRGIGQILTGLLELIHSKGFGNFIGDLLWKIRLQKTIVYTLSSLVMMQSEEELTSTERILKLNYETHFDMVFSEIVKLTTSIIACEAEMFHHHKAKVPPSNKYLPNVPLCRQPLYLESLLKTLTNSNLISCHKATLNAITASLPFYGTETGRIVSQVVECVCGTLNGCSEDIFYVGRMLESLTSITHYVLLEQNTVEKVQQQTSTHILYNLVSVFLPTGVSSKEKEGTSPTSGQPSVSPAKAELLLLLPHLLSTCLSIWRTPSSRLKVLDLINPIAFNHVSNFISAIGKQPEQMIPMAVELVLAMKVIIFENLVSGLISWVKTPEDEIHQVTLLRFLSIYLDKVKSLSDVWHLLVSLLKDGPGLPPKAQLILFEICHKMAVSGVPTAKTDLKEFQEANHKLIESVSSHSSTEKRYRNDTTLQLEVLECLTVHLCPLVDLVWSGSEDKVLPLVSSVVYYVISHVKFRYPATHYLKALNFIANLSPYSYLRKSWKKEVFEILLDQSFFTFSIEALPGWRTTLDNLFTQDKYTFTELLARVSVPQTGSLNIFSSKEIEYESRSMLLKRLAFVIFSSKKDQYAKFITNIQERLAEAIKMPQMIPMIQAQIFLCFRVLLLRLSPQHLNALWPIILHEILMVLIQMETDILTRNPNWLHLYLQLCKLLELTLNLPSSQLPMFQMYRWAFTGESSSCFIPHLNRLAELLESTKSTNGVKALRSNKIESLGELHEFLRNSERKEGDVREFEAVLENDFLE